ncbi:MAG: matrixin family metalloprotease [Cytophagaceae bacterium]|nr:matrixin family metalloprotease [Cytophagaceae bacterium]
MPIKVYSNHLEMEVDNSWTEVIKKAINTWNNAGASVGLMNNFFEYTDNASEAGLLFDWSGEGLPANALGVARLTNSNPTYIAGIIMRPPGSEDFARTAEVLIQEMGHILGIEHSGYPDDIMNGTAHGHIHEDLDQVEITQRDRQMLRWLYSRENYIAIIPK